MELRGVKLLTDTLHGLLDDTRELLDSSPSEPVEASPAAQELASLPDRELTRVPYCQGDQLLQVTAEHVVGFMRALDEPALTIAPWVSVRAVIESSALASWLLDPEIDAWARVTRSFALRFDGLLQQLKFARATKSQVEIKKALDRLDTVAAIASTAGFAVVRKKGRLTSIGQPMPSFTDLAKASNEEATYRLCSAMTHAHAWALQQLSFQIVQSDSDNDSLSVPTYYLRKAVNPVGLGYLALKTAESLTTPVLKKAKLFGWNATSLEAFIKVRFDELDRLAQSFVVQTRARKGV